MTNLSQRSGALLKTYSVLVFFLALKAVGNSAMAWGMKQVPERMSMNPTLYLRAMLNPFVAMGVVALILALLTRMALFSLADLSFVLPVTADRIRDRRVPGEGVPARNRLAPAMAGHAADLCRSRVGWDHVAQYHFVHWRGANEVGRW